MPSSQKQIDFLLSVTQSHRDRVIHPDVWDDGRSAVPGTWVSAHKYFPIHRSMVERLAGDPAQNSNEIPLFGIPLAVGYLVPRVPRTHNFYKSIKFAHQRVDPTGPQPIHRVPLKGEIYNGEEFFEDVMKSPDYPLTRGELDIINAQRNRAYWGELFSGGATLFSWGDGTGVKTARLHKLFGPDVIRNDIDPEVNRISYKNLRNSGYTKGAPFIAGNFLDKNFLSQPECVARRKDPRPIIYILSGGTVHNFIGTEVHQFLGGLSEVLRPQDKILLGLNLTQKIRLLRNIYDTPPVKRFAVGIYTYVRQGILSYPNESLPPYDTDPFRNVKPRIDTEVMPDGAKLVKLMIEDVARISKKNGAVGFDELDFDICTGFIVTHDKPLLEKIFAQEGVKAEMWLGPDEPDPRYDLQYVVLSRA